MILVPEAYTSQPRMKTNPELNSFYSYYESMQEAWDGPALLVFSDGKSVGAALDRNGLRPARFMVTSDSRGKETVHVMSEIGVTKALAQFADDGKSFNGNTLVQSGRLGPGEMLSVDLRSGKVALNDEIKKKVASARPYAEWTKKSIIPLERTSFKSGKIHNTTQHNSAFSFQLYLLSMCI
jgi:glutamate synthase (ferredoxin)